MEGYSDHSNNVAPAEGEINKGLRLGLMMAAKRHDRTWYAHVAEGQRTNHGSLLDMDIVTPATGLAGPRGQELGGIYIYIASRTGSTGRQMVSVYEPLVNRASRDLRIGVMNQAHGNNAV